MTYPPRPSDDEPRSQQFQPMSYDLAPEYGTPPPAEASQPPYQPSAPPYQQPSAPPYQQPPPQQPAYQQPYQPQPPYQQPGFPAQPTYPGQGYPVPGYPPPPPVPAKKGKGLKITLGVLGGLFLVCAIAACVLLYPVISESGAHVSAPATLPGGLNKETSDEMQTVVDQMETDLRKDVGDVDEVAAGIYSGDDPQKLVVLVAATSTILFPDSEIDDAFKGFTDSSTGTTMGDQTDFPAGKLGGTLKCATGSSDDVDMTLCAWADHGSVGIGVFIDRGLQESADLFVQIREAVEVR